jgi:5'-deoxynucleotidase YfbR-like HD superfamily hydrolase
VRRYHTWPVIYDQTVGEHSWNVMRLHYEIFHNLPSHVAIYILYHDAGELKVGDPPYPIKRNNPALKQEMDRVEEEALRELGITLPDLTNYEKLRVKLCDALDCKEYAFEELAMGNTTFEVVIDRIDELVNGSLAQKLDDYDLLCLNMYTSKRGWR